MVIVYALGLEWEEIKINQVADRPVNMEVDQEENMVSHIIPSNDLIPLLEADTWGVTFERILVVFSFVVYQKKRDFRTVFQMDWPKASFVYTKRSLMGAVGEIRE